MVETKVGFLVKAVESLTNNRECNPTQNLLKSYYLMRCRELTKGFGLPEKYFSSKVRCPRCFVEWKNGSDIKVQHIKLSKKQRRRIRQLKVNGTNKEYVDSQKELLSSNKIEQICTFCRNSTTTISQKPSKSDVTKLVPMLANKQFKDSNNKADKITKPIIEKTQQKGTANVSNKKPNRMRTSEMNVYSKSKDAFSLVNKDNTLQGVVKQTVIKNNKRKKDKFAGLCQQAVLASAKLKEEKKKENKLNLFLKPSS